VYPGDFCELVIEDEEARRTSDPQTVHIQERVAHAEQLIRSMVKVPVIVVRQQLGKVVLGALLGD
jgi:hypothetical protein